MKNCRFFVFFLLFLFCFGLPNAILFADINRWTKIGPDGGDIKDLLMDPQSSETLYAHVNSALYYKTTDGGALWTPINGDIPDPYSMSSLSIYQQDSSILYARTGTNIYRSLNGGGHWELRSSLDQLIVLAVSPENPEVVFAGTGDGIFKSTDGGLTWNQVSALQDVQIIRFPLGHSKILYVLGGTFFAKSEDHGASWISSSITPWTFPSDMAIDPANPSIVYALYGCGLFKSVNGGLTWTKITNFLAETITINPANSSEIYLGYLSADPNNFFFNTTRSTDGGQTWGGIFSLDRYRFLFDPNDTNVIYSAAWKKGLYKSLDGGQTWIFSSHGMQKLEEAEMTYPPQSDSPYLQSPGSTIYVGCRVGLMKSTDGGTNWIKIDDDLTNTCFADLSIYDSGGINLLTGIKNFAEGWTTTPGGVYESNDGGVHWTDLNQGLSNRDVRRVVKSPPLSQAASFAATSQKTTPCIFAATAGGLFKSSDGGLTWQAKNTGLASLNLTDMIVHPSNQNILFISNNAGVFKSENGADSWAATGLSLETHCLEIDPDNPAVIYAGTSSGVFKSQDSGSTWNLQPDGIGILAISALVIDPTESSRIIAGTSSAGIYLSRDAAESWQAVNRGLTNLSIHEVLIDPLDPSTIYASTNGDGLFKITIVPAPEISLDKTSFLFGGQAGGPFTPPQFIRIANRGDATLNWTATPSAPWIQLAPTTGIDAGRIAVSIDPTGLAAGSYSGSFSVEDPMAVNSPQTVTVALDVFEPGTTQPPFGSLDSPIEGAAGLAGSIAVTGWALDDIGVQDVSIYRDPLGGEPVGTNGLVYVGRAVIVEGARPDVEAAYPGYPQNERAGWGYMLLTNFLPNAGNGTFTLYAMASDIEGYQTEIGRKTISCNNADAVLPFGAIDTPAQGGDASGAAYANFGWALTPPPNAIPVDGSTILVWVDGLPLGHPVYNNYRADIATLFPGYANSNGAVGYFPLDTTGYAYGTHTIAWSVVDSAGNTDGIGSRYFQIENITAASVQSAQTAGHSAANVATSAKPLYIRTGFDAGPPGLPIYAQQGKAAVAVIPELERIAVYLDKTYSGENLNDLMEERERLHRERKSSISNEDNIPVRRYEGFLRVNGELRALPAGSTFDAERGIFYWQPGPGFIGDYDFVFLDSNRNESFPLKIRIQPKEPEMMISNFVPNV